MAQREGTITLIKEFIFIIISFIILIKSADIFVNAAINLARKLKIPEIIIGCSIVSIGTTFPELIVSSIGAFKGHGELALNNGLGSIIFNGCIIGSLVMLVGNNNLSSNQIKTIKFPILLYYISSIIILFTGLSYGIFDYRTGLTLLLLFIIYCFYMFISANRQNSSKYSNDISEKFVSIFIKLVISAMSLAIFSNILVDNSVLVASELGVSEKMIGFTILAVGTSLPELITAITSIRKGHNALSFGNIIGANLFDITLVTGLPMIIKSFENTDYLLIITGLITMIFLGIIVYTNKYKRLISIFLILTYLSYTIYNLGV